MDTAYEDSVYQLSPGLASAFNEPFFSRTPSPDSIPETKSPENTTVDLTANTPGTSADAVHKTQRDGLESSSHSTSTGAFPRTQIKEGRSKMKSPSKRSSYQPYSITKKKSRMSNEEDASHSGSIQTKFDVGEVAAHVTSLSEMFPEADPQFLWDRCEQFGNDQTAFNELIMDMLSKNDYPRGKLLILFYLQIFNNSHIGFLIYLFLLFDLLLFFPFHPFNGYI